MLKTSKKFLSLLLAVMMLVSLFPVGVFASETGEDVIPNPNPNPEEDPLEIIAIMITGSTSVVKAPVKGYPAITYPAFTAIPLTRGGISEEIVPITWSVDYPGISIDDKGVLTVTSDAKFGRFTITATAPNGVSCTLSVPVLETKSYEVDDPSPEENSSRFDIYNYWDNWDVVESDIQLADDGEIIEVDFGGKFKTIPWYIITALRDYPTIGLKILKDDKLVLEIPAGKIPTNLTVHSYYTFSDVEKLISGTYNETVSTEEIPEPDPSDSEIEPEEIDEAEPEETPEETSDSVVEEPIFQPKEDSVEPEAPVQEETEEDPHENTNHIAIALAAASAVVILTTLICILRKKKQNKS